MNKLSKILAVGALCFFGFAANAQSTNDQALIGRARAAAHECLKNNNQFNISASAETTGICFVQGTLNRVTFVGTPNCAPNEPCPMIAVLIATVDFDCDGNATVTYCGGN